MHRAQLPVSKNLRHRPRKIQQHIDLMNRLIHQRAAAFHLPRSLDRPAEVFGGTVPLHISICLQNLPQSPIRDRLFQKLNRVVEAMLAHHAQLNPRTPRHIEHRPTPSQDSSPSASAPGCVSSTWRTVPAAANENSAACKHPRCPHSDGCTTPPPWAQTPRRSLPQICARSPRRCRCMPSPGTRCSCRPAHSCARLRPSQ